MLPYPFEEKKKIIVPLMVVTRITRIPAVTGILVRILVVTRIPVRIPAFFKSGQNSSSGSTRTRYDFQKSGSSLTGTRYHLKISGSD